MQDLLNLSNRIESMITPMHQRETVRRRIYAIYSHLARLEDKGGDQITELATLRSLSTRFEVYYNNQRFIPELPGFGFSKQDVEPPDTDYDLVYVRSNKKVFAESKERGYLTAYFGEY